MSFWTFKKKPYPILAFAASIFFIVFGLVMARNAHFSWFLLGAYIWLFLFGCRKGCLHVIGPFFLCGGIFGVIAYFAYGRNFASALAMVNRFGAVFLSIALGMSMEPIDMTRNLSTLRVPRGIRNLYHPAGQPDLCGKGRQNPVRRERRQPCQAA